MRKGIIKITGTIMMLVFLVAIAPKEYLHDLLFHHRDTIDAPLKKGEQVLGHRHAHCSFLNFEFAHFIATDKQVFRFEETVYKTSYLLPVYYYCYSVSAYTLYLRGPPLQLC